MCTEVVLIRMGRGKWQVKLNFLFGGPLHLLSFPPPNLLLRPLKPPSNRKFPVLYYKASRNTMPTSSTLNLSSIAKLMSAQEITSSYPPVNIPLLGESQWYQRWSQHVWVLYPHGHPHNLSHRNGPVNHQGQGISVVFTTIFLSPPSFSIGQVITPILWDGKDIFLEGVGGLDLGGAEYAKG